MQLKKEKVNIGEKEFTIKELTCLGRNALLDIVGSFTFSDIMKSVMPILDELGIKFDADEEDSIGKLISLGLQNEHIWGGLVACLINVLQVGPQVIYLSLDNPSEEDRNYVGENLTISQEPKILKKIIELNRLPETIKNLKSLLTEVRGLMTTETS